MFLFGCKNTSPASNNETETGYNGVTEVHLTYDKNYGDQFYMDADVVKMSDKGAKLKITKRIGPDNYTGTKKEGTIDLDKSQVDELFEIMGRHDLQSFTNYPAYGSISGPVRTLFVLNGDNIVYSVCFNTHFPETLPPEEDIMYCEMFNFFNDLIANEDGWEDVVGENLEDPRNNPAYYDRTVTWFGNEVKLVPGTGTYHEDGRYAEIDYEGKKWWIEEGFIGEWTLDKEKTEDVSAASLTVNEDGSLLLTVDGVIHKGTVGEIRRYKDSVLIGIEIDGSERGATVDLLYEESYESIRIMCFPNPVPDEQFDSIDVYLLKK